MTRIRYVVLATLLVAVVVPSAAIPPTTAATGEPPTFVVDRNSDHSDAVCVAASGTPPTTSATEGRCSLRAAVAAANGTSGATVVLRSGVFTLNGRSNGDSGDIDIAAPMTIRGARRAPGATATTIDAISLDRVFEVAAAGVVIEGVVITSGAARNGAGVYVRPGASLRLLDSTVHGNRAADQGGGVDNAGITVIERSTISSNEATKKGGGVHNSSDVTILNSTIDGNTSSSGGGVVTTGDADLTHVTITRNQSTNRLGGGVQRVGGTTTIVASIIAENKANSSDAKDCSGSPFLDGKNLIENVSGCNPTGTPPIVAAPVLGPLSNNGGASNTRALQQASPARDVLDSPCPMPVDQRNVTRPQRIDTSSALKCDLGAFELDPFSFSLELSADVQTIGAGASIVPTSSLLTGARTPTSTTASPLRSVPLRSVTLDSIRLDAVPLRSITIEGAPLRSVPLRSVPLRSVFLAFAPLRSVPLRSVSLDSILLSEVEVEGGWERLLAGTALEGLPLQTLTLSDVAGLEVSDTHPLATFTIGETNLGATRIGALSIASILLGATPLRSVPLTGTTWCALLGDTCAELAAAGIVVDEASLMTLDLAGAPLRSVPLRSVPLRSVELPDLGLQSAPLRSVLLSDLKPDGGASLVTCASAPCTYRTVGDVFDADAWRADVSLAHLLLAIIGPDDLGWESVDLTGGGLGAVADPKEPGVTYTAQMYVGGGSAVDIDLTVTIPRGFYVEPDSVRLDGVAVPDAAIEADLDADPQVVHVHLDDVSPGDRYFTFLARAGVLLGQETVSVAAVATTPTGESSGTQDEVTTTVEVIEAFEGGATEDDQLDLTFGALHIAHISAPADVDFYRFTVGGPDGDVADGATVSLRLDNIESGEDFDLALYGPPAPQLRGVPDEQRDMLPDHLIDLAPADDLLTAEPTSDVPRTLPFDTEAPTVLHRVGGRRGNAPEALESVRLRAGTYWIQVSSANGSFSEQPYVLRARASGAVNRGACATEPLVGAYAESTPELDPTVDTLFLVNQQRLVSAYPAPAQPGAASGADAVAAITEFAASPGMGFKGGVVFLDAYPAVRTAYTAWESARCSPDKANDVVREIGAVIDGIAAGLPDLEHLVIVGGDQQIPMARVSDNTVIANERTFADEFEQNNELVSALGAAHVLTDDAYATRSGIQVNDHEVFVPELAVGRLVETPNEILTMLDSFEGANGTLAASTALVSGYDFLSDGANAVADALDGSPALAPADRSLIDGPGDLSPWSAQDLYDSLAGLGQGPGLASVNAHFDHHRLLPSQGDATGSEDDLFVSQPAGGSVGMDSTLRTAIERSLLFSMGCHSGLSVADVIVAPGATDDWAQTFARSGASWVGNTGVGYGDTETVALSERLMATFAARLVAGDSVGVGRSAAKREYMSTRLLVSAYDEKVVQEAVLYGLPMLRIGEPAEAPASLMALAAPSSPLVTDPLTGFASAQHTLDLNAALTTPVTTPSGSYYHVDGETLTQSRRPIQPLTSFDVTNADQRALGVLVTDLVSRDEAGFEPVFFTPTVDLADHEPSAVAADATFPSVMAGIASTHGPDGRQDRLVVAPGQFRASSEAGTGTQRLFTDIAATVYYGNGPAPERPVGMRRATAAYQSGDPDDRGIRFEVELDADARRVYVLHKVKGLSGRVDWDGLDLVQDPDTGHWIGHGVTDGEVEYIVQIVGLDGRVHWADQKGGNFDAEPGDVDGLTIEVEPMTKSGDWYIGNPVYVAMSGGAGTIEYSLNGGPWTTYQDRLVIDADGVYTLLARSGDFTMSKVLLVDGNNPTVTITPDDATDPWYGAPLSVGVSVGDGTGSGVDEWSYQIDDGNLVYPEGASATLALSQSSTVTVVATDRAGRTTTVVRAFRIDATRPTITIVSPTVGAFYGIGSSASASFSCADSGSGVATCTASVQPPTGSAVAVTNNGSLPTSTAGTYVMTVTATDNVGLQRTASVSYVVGRKYLICPQYDVNQENLIGSTIPIKIQLCDSAGRNLSSSTIPVVAVSIDKATTPPPNWVGNTNFGNAFRFGQKTYIYNLDTSFLPDLTRGSHRMYLRIAGIEHDDYFVQFSVRP